MTELQSYLRLAFKAELHCLEEILHKCCDIEFIFCACRGAERFMVGCTLLEYTDDMTVGATIGMIWGNLI